MAKNRSRAQRRVRKRAIAERSAQARLNESKREVTSLRNYSDRALGRLTDRQLLSVARNLGLQQDRAQQQALREAQKQFYNVPQITVTKRDRMYAERPDISDAEIEAAQGGRRKLLRQQQKRRYEAKRKIRRSQENRRLLADRTIQQQRDMEASHEDVAETGLPDSVLQGEPATRALLSMRNVLSDDRFVRTMTREQLEREVKDVAERLGEDTGQVRRAKGPGGRKAGKVGQKGGKRYRDYVRDSNHHKLKDAFGTELSHIYDRLTDKQRSFLQNATNFTAVLSAVIDSYTDKGAKRARYRFNSDSGKDRSAVMRELKDFMVQARKYA